MKIAYRRTSTVDQNLDRQDIQDVDRVFEEQLSGTTMDRPALQEMLLFCREGDEVLVWSIDRLARSLKDCLEIVQTLNDKGVIITFITESLTFKPDSECAFSKLQLQMLSAFSEYEVSISSIRRREGIAKAKAKGIYCKKDKGVDHSTIARLHKLDVPKAQIAKRMGISRMSVYRSLAA